MSIDGDSRTYIEDSGDWFNVGPDGQLRSASDYTAEQLATATRHAHQSEHQDGRSPKPKLSEEGEISHAEEKISRAAVEEPGDWSNVGPDGHFRSASTLTLDQLAAARREAPVEGVEYTLLEN